MGADPNIFNRMTGAQRATYQVDLVRLHKRLALIGAIGAVMGLVALGMALALLR